MFPLAFDAGWLQGHWWGFISRNYVVWPTFLLMNVFIALKGSHFWFLLETPNTISRAVRSPQSACMKPLRARVRPIGSKRPADLVRNTYRTHTAVQGLLHAGPKSWESSIWKLWKLNFFATAPLQIQNSAKTLCALIRHTYRFLTGFARDFHVTEPFKNGDDEAKLNYVYARPQTRHRDGGISHPWR